MIKRFATLLCLALAALSARAEVVGVMADSATGDVYPAALETRLVNANGYKAEHAFPADGRIVTVTGVVQAVYSDTEANVTDLSLFNSYFDESRLEFENWDTGGQGVLAVSETNAFQGALTGIDMTFVTNGVRLVLDGGAEVWVDRVTADEDPTFVSFHPPLLTNTSLPVVGVHGAALDDLGLHFGEATGVASDFSSLPLSPMVTSGNTGFALATHDGVTVYESHSYGGGVYKSTDGGLTWSLLPGSPAANGGCLALATHDGKTIYESHHGGGGVYKSTDGGLTWSLLPGSPAVSSDAAFRVSLATHDGVTIYESHNGETGIHKSTDSGLTWHTIASFPTASGYYGVALATHDGVTVYEIDNGSNGVRVSYDCGQTWSVIPDSPSGSYSNFISTPDGHTIFVCFRELIYKSTDGGLTWNTFASLSGVTGINNVAFASHDGLTLYESHCSSAVRKSSPLFASQSTNTYTVIVDATTNDVVSVKDFAVGIPGRGDIYSALETDDDEWSVWAVGEYPFAWKTVAKKVGNEWYVRSDTNGTMTSTMAMSAPEALSIALVTNRYNRVPWTGYSPIYGYSAFNRGRPVRISLTFMPIAAYTNNAANVTSISVLSSRYADGYKWDTDAFDIRLVSTNPVISEVGWPESLDTRSVIFYAPRKDEEEE